MTGITVVDPEKKLAEIDIYRNTPIRYLGYANEVGEAFRALVPISIVRLSYVVASGYVLADTMDKSHKVSIQPFANASERRTQVAVTAADTVLWQGLASVAIPGFTINRLCALTAAVLRRTTTLAPPLLKGLTTAVGLSAIPFIVRPIDAFVELAMDESIRKWYPPRARAL